MTSLSDRVVGWFSPARSGHRQMQRAYMESGHFTRTLQNLSSGYYRGNRRGRKLEDWTTANWDVNAMLAENQTDLRNDSNDLMTNNPIANGAVQTKVTNVIGAGLTLQSKIDREFLGIEEDAALRWQKEAERHWKLFSLTADVQHGMSMAQLQALAYQSAMVNGDVFVNLPMVDRPGVQYETAINLIEGHRVSNPDEQPDTDKRIMGVEFDNRGIPKFYHVRGQHPGVSSSVENEKKSTWRKLKVFDSNGQRLVLHLFERLRVNQARGIPMLAPIIEPLKKLDTYAEAELDNAVISSFFTVFVKTKFASDKAFNVVDNLGGETGATTSDKDFKLASGNILQLHDGEEVSFADPQRPNANFEIFFSAFTQQVAIALNMPAEVLLKKFNTSYTASRGALLEAWKHFLVHRAWVAHSFCDPVYQAMLFEAVAKGWISAPGFLTDPMVRMAYCGCSWVGQELAQLDPLKEAKAASVDIASGLTNEFIEAQKRGRDFDQVHEGRVQAHNMREEAGLLEENMQNAVPDSDRDEDKDDDEGANS